MDISNLAKNQHPKKGCTHEQLAWVVGSGQPRIAKLVGGDSGITLDLMLKALLHLRT